MGQETTPNSFRTPVTRQKTDLSAARNNGAPAKNTKKIRKKRHIPRFKEVNTRLLRRALRRGSGSVPPVLKTLFSQQKTNKQKGPKEDRSHRC